MMAFKKERIEALRLRSKGYSYSQIRQHIPVSKSTLSNWLGHLPLSRQKINTLRGSNPKRIELFRETMRKKRESRIAIQENRSRKDIYHISKRELFIGGFFLFWGEGAKRRSGEVSLANTDPAMIRAFIQWLAVLGIKRNNMRFTLHLYGDMDKREEVSYWARELHVPMSSFYKPYIKKTTKEQITYRTGFGHGTCNARCNSQILNDYVLTGLQYIRSLYKR
jgi:hypothetical protein